MYDQLDRWTDGELGRGLSRWDLWGGQQVWGSRECAELLAGESKKRGQHLELALLPVGGWVAYKVSVQPRPGPGQG